ncbi:hypothetical protein B0H12DRAFT_1243555 [Mycena haematopus]|nr:hypothetical protein B0H12DRAFT_1243555 [Mycena haematopus]
MDHSDAPASHFGAPSAYSTPRIHQDTQNGPPPPPHWHAQSYAAAVSAPAQTPIVNTHYSAQGYRGHDGRGPDGPVNPDDQYQFSLRPVTTTIQPIPIDPALQHSTEQAPFIHPRHRVDHEHRPRSKKPEVRTKPSQKTKKNNKSKDKARDASPSSGSDDDAHSKARNGRSGVRNYNKADKELLFSIVQQMARKTGRPERAFSSLKAKYSSYTKQKKPTGEGERPPDVRRAHEIEDLINNKAGTRDVDDDNSELEDDDSSDSDVPKVVEPVRSAIARRAASPPLRRPRTSAADAVNTLVRSLDPATLRARDDARAHHSFERTQFMTLSSQLDGLRNELSALQRENSDLKRERDRADMERTWAARLDQVARGRRSGRSRSSSHPRHHGRGRGRTTYAERDGLQRVGGKVRTDYRYPDGGAVTFWETDTSSNATDFDHQPKKKQRKRSPTPYQRRTPTPSPPRRPISRRRTPTPGPSRLPFTSTPPTPPTSATLVSGNAVELVMTPRRGGAPLGFIITPNVYRKVMESCYTIFAPLISKQHLLETIPHLLIIRSLSPQRHIDRPDLIMPDSLRPVIVKSDTDFQQVSPPLSIVNVQR